MSDQNEYKAIQAWGEILGSCQWFVDSDINHAIQDKAPSNAIYKNKSGEWQTINDIKSIHTLRQISNILNR